MYRNLQIAKKQLQTQWNQTSLLEKMAKQHQTALKYAWLSKLKMWKIFLTRSRLCVTEYVSTRTGWMIVLIQVGGWDDIRRVPIKSMFLWLADNIKNGITGFKNYNESLGEWLMESRVKLLFSLKSQSCIIVQSWHLALSSFARRTINVCLTLHWPILWLKTSL